MQPRRDKFSYLSVVGLALLALLGNYFGLTLFFGVEFIFGSIASLLAIAVLGSRAGIVVSIVGAIYTIYAWNHPYAAVVLFCEAIFVALTLHRFKFSLALSSGSFWVLIGTPLVWFLYRFGLGMDNDGAVLIAVKQAANGILNALVASLLITYLPLRTWLDRDGAPKIPVFQHTFNIFVALALLPAGLLVILDARNTVGRVEKEIRSEADRVSTGISISISRWSAQHIKAVEHLAIMAEDFGVQDRASLQKYLEETRKIWPNFLGLFFTDAEGTTVAFDPPFNKHGEKTLGLNFADREYFQVLKAGKESYLSNVFMARGGVFEPVVNMVSRLDINGGFAGIISASLNLKDLARIFSDVQVRSPFVVTLVQADGTIVASSDPKQKPLGTYLANQEGDRVPLDDGFFRKWPENRKQAPMEVWKHSFLSKEVAVPGMEKWRLIVDLPHAPWQSEVYARYIQILSFLIVLALIILLGSLWLANSISQPLRRLSFETTNLPERLESNQKIDWPVSRLSELGTLSENFRVMVDALKRRFQDLEISRRELDRGNKVKDDFLAILSHELRTPLNAILGHSELLKFDLPREEELESVEAIYRNAKAQNQIIADLLDVSSIITGKITFNPEPISLNETIKAAVNSLKQSAEAKKQELKIELADSDVTIFADGTRLQQVLWNLLSNAVKFTPEGGEIVVSSEVKDFGCTIKVADSGQGIEQDFLPLIFDRFRQEDGSITRKHGGLGLGLSIVKQIVETHEGKILAESKGRDRGSAFTVVIPSSRYVDNQKIQIQKPAPAKKTPSLSGKRILVIDDDPDARALSLRFLQGTGAKIETANSAAEGLEKFRTFKPEVVVSDIGMPGEDGFSLIRKLRQLEDGASVPAAAVTAFAGEADRAAILSAGFQAHVTKPVTKEELTRVVAELSESPL